MSNIHTIEELNEVEPLNFDRYEKQLSKLAKGSELSNFVMATCENEMRNLKTVHDKAF